jgi:hypothetical protein
MEKKDERPVIDLFQIIEILIRERDDNENETCVRNHSRICK